MTDSAPVIGIYESDSTGFLAQLSLRDLELKSSKLTRGDYEIDQVVRLAVNVDGNEVQPGTERCSSISQQKRDVDGTCA